MMSYTRNIVGCPGKNIDRDLNDMYTFDPGLNLKGKFSLNHFEVCPQHVIDKYNVNYRPFDYKIPINHGGSRRCRMPYNT